MNINNIINEGFEIKNNLIYFNPASNNILKTSFGRGNSKMPYQTKLFFGIAYSAYIRNKTSNQQDYKEFLLALKNKSSIYHFDITSYNKFLQRTAFYLSKFIIKENIDTIIIMESLSNLLFDFYIKLIKYLPKYYSNFSYNKAIFKTPDLSKIKFQIEKNKNISQKTINSLQQIIEKQKHINHFSIKTFPPQFRKFIIDYLVLNQNILSHIINKNIILLDDILTTGSTLNEASRLLKDAGANKVIGLTILKS